MGELLGVAIERKGGPVLDRSGQRPNRQTTTRVVDGQVPLGHTTEASEMNARVHFRADGVC